MKTILAIVFIIAGTALMFIPYKWQTQDVLFGAMGVMLVGIGVLQVGR